MVAQDAPQLMPPPRRVRRGPRARRAPPLISFVSDFGQGDAYVGTVRAVMLAICPQARIVDLTHAIRPQSTLHAVLQTQQAWPFFPEGAVHLAVIDPGVGTTRRAIALSGPRGFAVGPDNGVLSAFLPGEARARAQPLAGAATGDPFPLASLAPLPAGFVAREILNQDVIRSTPSATFHGRDIFGPAAAHLAAGFPFAALGPRCATILAFPPIRASLVDGRVTGVVLDIDRFGNLITSVRRADLPAHASGVEIVGRRLPLVHTYGEQADLCCLIGSGGYLEVALPNGNAAATLGAAIGATVQVLER